MAIRPVDPSLILDRRDGAGSSGKTLSARGWQEASRRRSPARIVAGRRRQLSSFARSASIIAFTSAMAAASLSAARERTTMLVSGPVSDQNG